MRSRIKIYAARTLRKDQTNAEAMLWEYLRDKRLKGVKFRRQHILRGFILDFYCPQAKLAIELDGLIHKKQKEADKERQAILESIGVTFLRFSNEQVYNEADIIIDSIYGFVLKHIPLSCGAGEGLGVRS